MVFFINIESLLPHSRISARSMIIGFLATLAVVMLALVSNSMSTQNSQLLASHQFEYKGNPYSALCSGVISLCLSNISKLTSDFNASPNSSWIINGLHFRKLGTIVGQIYITSFVDIEYHALADSPEHLCLYTKGPSSSFTAQVKARLQIAFSYLSMLFAAVTP